VWQRAVLVLKQAGAICKDAAGKIDDSAAAFDALIDAASPDPT
jgi:hypothetical protein